MTMPTANQLRAAGSALRKDGQDEAAAHLETHADVLDKAKAHKTLDAHLAGLDDDGLAKFNRSDVLEPAELDLVQTQISVAPLAAGADILLQEPLVSVSRARILIGLDEPAAEEPAS